MENFPFNVISNKSVRAKEKHLEVFESSVKYLPNLIHTGRGWFIDSRNVDHKSVEDWFAINAKAESQLASVE